MPYFIITYDERASTRNYQPLYKQLTDWNAAHLQNSVWLANLKGPADAVRDILQSHMHPDDTICVIELPQPIRDWATRHARAEGVSWLKNR